jgi:hypothetical protein
MFQSLTSPHAHSMRHSVTVFLSPPTQTINDKLSMFHSLTSPHTHSMRQSVTVFLSPPTQTIDDKLSMFQSLTLLHTFAMPDSRNGVFRDYFTTSLFQANSQPHTFSLMQSFIQSPPLRNKTVTLMIHSLAHRINQDIKLSKKTPTM